VTGGDTAAFLGPPETWGAASLSLSDAHGLWGGRRLFLAGDGSVLVQSLSPAQREARHALQLTPEEALALFKACVTGNVLALTFALRPIIPDEVLTTLTLVNAGGEGRQVHKWSADRHAAFEDLYAALLEVEARALREPCLYHGPADFEFQPAWFPR
jgi:hypothetical protein